MSVQCELSSLRTDGQNDLTSLVVSSRNFANALKNTAHSTIRCAKPTEQDFRLRREIDVIRALLGYFSAMVLIAYRRFGITHRYNFQIKISIEDWTDSMCRNVGKELLL